MAAASYTKVDLEQGTTAWQEWRNQGIGASDAPVIMGENPWKSASTLLEEKCRKIIVTPNAAMARGTRLEPEARRRYVARFGISVVPACIQSTVHDWLRASVDGIAADGSAVVEIKCGDSVYRKSASTKRVPDYYVGQLQHILAITSLPAIDFWCYLPCRPEVHIRVERDASYIDDLIEAEEAFWNRLLQRRAD